MLMNQMTCMILLEVNRKFPSQYMRGECVMK